MTSLLATLPVEPPPGLPPVEGATWQLSQLVSVLGLLVMILLAWLMSSHKSRMPWRVVFAGLALQFGFALLVLKNQYGRGVFEWLGVVFRELLNCVDSGCLFLFGTDFTDHFFAFKVLPTIIFFSSFMAIFYYLGMMQWIVGAMAKLMQKTLGTSGAETLAAAANVFVGQTEAPLVIRPYINTMTLSELNSLMVGGFATVAGGVLAAYVGMGISPMHLLSASVISAPAALLIAKVMQPETERPQTLGVVNVKVASTASNVMEAIANGAVDGLKLALNVGAMLLVFLALIAVINGIIGWGAGLIEVRWGESLDELFDVQFQYDRWSLELWLGYLFAPFAWLMGIEWADCLKSGELLGLKTVANEFIAYEGLHEAEQAQQLSERSVTILTYALCGFANFSSIGIQLGGIGGIAPGRQSDLAKLGLRAMIGGTLAAFMTACVAGVLM